ncbi:MAG: SCP2 sterol-binding domain-containing protein, partial [Rhodanobacteraceae bacterium]
ALGLLLERAINSVLVLDAESRARLAAFDGRALTLKFRNTPLALRIHMRGNHVAIGPAIEGDSALTIRTTPGRLLAMAMRAGTGNELSPGAVEIAGDAEFARQLDVIMSKFAPDIDVAFTRLFGDVVGFQLARALRTAFGWSRDMSRSFARDTVEFLTAESRDLVAGPEVERFLDDVDAVREGVDRLAARIARLQGQPGNSGT